MRPSKCLLWAATLAAAGCGSVGWAQQVLPSLPGAEGAGTLAGGGADGAPRAAAGQKNSLVWRATSTVYVSDNISNQGNAQGADPGKDFGALLRVGPGVQWQRSSAGLQASVDYSLFAQRYIKTPQLGRDVQQALRASLRTELIQNHFSVDGQASISQQSRSAFGQQQGPGNLDNANSTEVASVALAPRWRARLGSAVAAEASHQLSVTRAKDSVTGDGQSQSTSLALRNAARQRLGWTAQALRQVNSPLGARRTESLQARLGLSWVPDVDWSATAFAGRERSDLSSLTPETGGIYGGSATWSPTPRTRATVGAEHRVFGSLYNASLDHRFSRVSVRLSDSRAVNQPGLVGALSNASNYDLLFAQLAAQEPDAARRDALVRATLQQQGLDPDARAANGFLSNTPSVSRQQLLGVAYQMPRASVGAVASRTRTSRLGAGAGGTAPDDLAGSAFVTSKAWGLNGGYRLSPTSNLSLTASWQQNQGDSTGLRNELRSLSLGWSVRLGQRTQGVLTLRHSDFESTLRPYTENAVLGSLQQQF